jgi:hypothetical protein
MSFAPVLPLSGLAGWRYLDTTLDRQQDAHARNPMQARDVAYFRENISGLSSAADLVADRRLLTVALGAFGLDDDINNKAFIRKVLEDGTSDRSALSNRLADKRYRDLSEAFGLGDGQIPQTGRSDFADNLISRHQERQFEIAVGNQSEDLRIALTLRRELPALVSEGSTEDTKWLQILGNPPLRQAFERAFGMPASFAGIDLDRQVSEMKDKALNRFGSSDPAAFADPDRGEELVELYLLRSQILSPVSGYSSASVALTLLQSANGAL